MIIGLFENCVKSGVIAFTAGPAVLKVSIPSAPFLNSEPYTNTLQAPAAPAKLAKSATL